MQPEMSRESNRCAGGGFSCTKNALIALNSVYVLVAIVLVTVGAYCLHASVVSSVPVVGGVIAMGVFLAILAVGGCCAAVRHDQVMLFFYMLILFVVFIVQFSLALACLAVDEAHVQQLVTGGWHRLQAGGLNSTIFDAEVNFKCCGLTADDQTTTGWQCERLSCGGTVGCPPCLPLLTHSGTSGAQAVGGVGLFFSLTEMVGVWLAMRYRNQKDPFADPRAAFR